MAVKRVIVLTVGSNGTELSTNGVNWFPITSGVRTQTAGSQWVPSGTSLGASTAENQAIQAGTIYEENWSRNFPIGTTAANMEAVLAQLWADRNAQINGQGANIFYGVFFDGTAWSQS